MINVLIRATMTDEYNKEVLAVISRLRSKAVDVPGYVSSEIVWNQTNRQFVWISKWHSREAWKALEDEPGFQVAAKET
jgi:heme-degrading monooxygenase HmoA